MKNNKKHTSDSEKLTNKNIREKVSDFRYILEEIKPFLKHKMQRVSSDKQAWETIQTSKIQ
jgi:hypothetical protein